MSAIGLVLLAAGGSSRMGTAKQLLPFAGRPLVRHAAGIALASVCRPVIVVAGARSQAIRESLDGLPLDIVTNERWSEGMGASIQAGVERAWELCLDAIVLALADQPWITSATYNRLVSAHANSGAHVVASQYSGTVGVPALFSREFFPRLTALSPTEGCKRIILAAGENSVLLPCPEAELDIDTPEDYQRISADNYLSPGIEQ